ncbi:SIMPL domain-containing protein [Desulfurispira natronophila]|uniref:Putative secreted protein n=1 Tax=Desulfurispira natronophila TaxID=682562 RepID=A0A7W7Y2L2_9BACT|nr:putative secreted protein [Desulfurispira natronophila]
MTEKVEIENDKVRAIMRYSTQSSEPSAAADEVNEIMNWAQRQLRTFSELDVSHRAYHSTPVNLRSRDTDPGPVRWEVQQDIELKSQSILQVEQAVARLQEKLLVVSMDFFPSDEARKCQEQQLLGKALRSFSKKAKFVAHQMGAEGYGLGELHINTSTQMPREMGIMRATVQDGSVQPPAMEPGSTPMQVRVRGNILLKLPLTY